MNPQAGEPPIEPPAGGPAGYAEQPEQKIVGYCRNCGKPLTDLSKRVALGTIYCEEHAPHVGAPSPVDPPSPYMATQAPRPAVANVSPLLAFFLGTIPGVGAIYNGQYAKGFIHVVIFGLLVSILGSDNNGGLEPLFGLMLAAFVFYQAFEAYHTARNRQLGQPVDEFSSLVAMSSTNRGFLAGPVVLIAIGSLFLLSNLGLLNMRQILRFWPVILIVIGVSMLMSRARGNGRPEHEAMRERMSHEQR